MRKRVEKVLSPNDVGATGTHQSGILIPKKSDLLSFFPQLNSEAENPRHILQFEDDLGRIWKFALIYYNNKRRGGTRNEYRLTRMTEFMHQYGAKEGDVLFFECIDGEYSVGIESSSARCQEEDEGVIKLELDGNWRVINYK